MVLATLPKRRHTVHDKKRHGQHHKPSKHYAKTYWPYLPMLLVAICGVLLNATWSVGSSVLGYATSISPSGLLQETNQQRVKNNAEALAMNSTLSHAAQAKAEDMAARNYWSHTTPDGAQPWSFIANAKYNYISAGENLAYGFDSSAAAVAGWMNSSSHRANLLNNNYSEVGFGIANSTNFQKDGEQTIVVAMYAQPEAIAQTAHATPQNSALPNQQQVRLLAAKDVSRIDVLTNGNARWAALVVSAIAVIGIFTLLITHIKLWRKYLTRGEHFIVRHPIFDAVVFAVSVLGFVLTRTSGFIH